MMSGQRCLHVCAKTANHDHRALENGAICSSLGIEAVMGGHKESKMYSDIVTDLAKKAGIEINNDQATILARTLVLAQDRLTHQAPNAEKTRH